MSKVIITAAITGGIHTPTMSPHLPVTPQQIANEAGAAFKAGAAIAHIHVRDPQTGKPLSDLDIFREVITKIKSKCDMILCLTTGGALGMPVEQRIAVVPEFKPELASLNAGSVNFALFPLLDKFKEFKFEWEKPYFEMTEDLVYPNTFKTMRAFCEIFEKNGTKPELEIYDTAMINNVAFMIEKGYLKKPVHLQFVLGILGGLPAETQTLVSLYETARRQIGDFTWSTCAAGRSQMPMCCAALTMGGNVRVGLEDNLYIGKGQLAKSNADQVAKIANIARELSLDIATPNEARQILGLKGLSKVNY